MEYSLTLYVYPSPYGVDWRSPHHLVRSVIKNSLFRKPRMIGHVAIELFPSKNSTGSDKITNPRVSFFTGMTTKFFKTNKKLLFWDRIGLGILFHQYPGHLETSEELIPERKKRLRSGHFSFIKFLLSEESYTKVLRYLTEFQEQKKHEWYGLPNRPRYSEGAGCSAFAASFLEIAGILDEEFRKNWSGQVRVPEELIGGREKNSRKVSILKLLSRNKMTSRWANPNEPGREVFFWDPDMIHRWILRKWNEMGPNDSLMKKHILDSTKGITIDMRDRVPTQESIWL